MRFRGRNVYKLLTLSVIVIIVILVIINLSSSRKFGSQNAFITQLSTMPIIGELTDNEIRDSSELFEKDTSITANKLVNLTDFQYIIENNRCTKYGKELLGIIIITSYVGHDYLRAAHRQAISQAKLSEMGLQRIFLLAQIPEKEHYIKQPQIEDENRKFDDLLQGNFVESYRNLTYKHIMGLRWAVLECPKAKFIIKIDDDIVYDVFQLKSYLENLEVAGSRKYFLAGCVMDTKIPVRVSASKWYVSQEEYSGNAYPEYLSGWFYITNPATAKQLVLQSEIEKFFWIDDTWITGVLRSRLRIPIITLSSWFSADALYMDCCVRDLKQSSPYECEFFVGPNGGDSKLIIEFLHNVEKCYFDECTKRSPEISLKKTCVGSVKNLHPDHGDASVRVVKLR